MIGGLAPDRDIPRCAVSCTQRDGSSASHDFQNDSFGVRKIGKIIERWQSTPADHPIQFRLDFGLNLRLTNGEQSGPLQCGFDCFASGAEHVADDLLHLPICGKFKFIGYHNGKH